MATIRDYYDRDLSRYMGISCTLDVRATSDRSLTCTVPARLHLDFLTNAQFISAYIPRAEAELPSIIAAMIDGHELVLTRGQDLVIYSQSPGCTAVHSGDLRFTGRTLIYTESPCGEDEKASLALYARQKGLFLLVRDPRYAAERARAEVPEAFICHDSRDKDLIARPLAQALQRLGVPVWFDEYSLHVGDSLRRSVEKGIMEASRCILVITKNFLTNEGWTKTEFDAVFNREVIEKADVVLPVWHDVTKEDVLHYSPSLAGRFAAEWSGGAEVAEAVAGKLLRSLRRPRATQPPYTESQKDPEST